MNETQAEVKALLAEAKKYYGLQKEHLRYTVAEQLTKALSAIAVAVIAVIVGLIIVVFACLALVHWLGSVIGSVALCYAIFAAVLLLLLLVFYLNRRRWVINPLARLMTSVFIKTEDDDEE